MPPLIPVGVEKLISRVLGAGVGGQVTAGGVIGLIGPIAPADAETKETSILKFLILSAR
jgi:hypothetical protein